MSNLEIEMTHQKQNVNFNEIILIKIVLDIISSAAVAQINKHIKYWMNL